MRSVWKENILNATQHTCWAQLKYREVENITKGIIQKQFRQYYF